MKTHDPFVIYERVYSDLRLVLNDAAYGKQFQKLKEAAEVRCALYYYCSMKYQGPIARSITVLLAGLFLPQIGCRVP